MFKNLVIYAIVTCSTLSLSYASAKTKSGLEDVTKGLATLNIAKQEVEKKDDGYSTDIEYAKHQAVSKRFFARLSIKPAVRNAVQKFKTELESKNPLTRITLDGLSSRSRVLLFRELTAAVKGEKQTIPFSFYGYKFSINLNPSLRQPSDGIVSKIGKHCEIYTVLKAHKESQKEIAKKLLKARKKTKKGTYHALIKNPVLSGESKGVDLDMLNVLLDFEVARRLQFTSDHDIAQRDDAGEYLDYIGDQGKEGESSGDQNDIAAAEIRYAMYNDFCENITASQKRNTQRAQNKNHDARKIRYMNSDRNKLDEVPVASAIVGALKLSADADQTELALQDFFHAPNKHSSDDYSYGTYSAFEGVPDKGHRSSATKKIIRKYRGGTHAKPSTEAQIKQDYLDVFGGNSESEAEA